MSQLQQQQQKKQQQHKQQKFDEQASWKVRHQSEGQDNHRSPSSPYLVTQPQLASSIDAPPDRRPVDSSLLHSGDDRSPNTRNSNEESSEVQTHSFPKPPSGSKFSSRSLYYNSQSASNPPRSPRDRLDDLLATEKDSLEGGLKPRPPVSGTEYRQLSDGRSHTKPDIRPQLLTVSSPTSSPRLASSVPNSPLLTMPSPAAHTAMDSTHPSGRKASVDSEMSASSQQSHGVKTSQDLSSTESTDIANLIASTGSPEAVIGRLLREKQSNANQNAQLWRLVEKQRAMILGLNKDLERLAKDKERYKKKLKDHIAQVPSGLDLTKKSSAEAVPSKAALRAADEIRSTTNNARDLSAEDAASQGIKGSQTIKPLEASRNDRKVLPTEPSFDGFGDDDSAVPVPHAQAVSPLHSPKKEGAPSPRGFAESRANPSVQRNHPPSLNLTKSTPTTGEKDKSKTPTPTRKPPPAPLDLSAPNSASSHLHQTGPAEKSDSEYDDVLEIDEIPNFDRGRRRTREEDDRLREAVAKKESQHRSQSKKSKKSKSAAPKADAEVPVKPKPTEAKSSAPRQAVPIAPPSNLAQLAQANSLASVLNKAPLNSQRFVNTPLPSPGLPASPRPSGRPLNSPAPRMPREGSNLSGLQSPPMSAAGGFPGMPLSPRAPRQPFPLPPNTPISIASPGISRPGPHNIGSPLHNQFQNMSVSTAPNASNVLQTQYRPIYRGLVSEQYPDLLLPPNALPLVLVKVSSSRMKPSRASFVSGKPKSDDDDVFTLGVFARSDRKELWRVEKDIMALPQLDQQLRRTSSFSAKLPDRSLFIGHAPARMDARRAALDEFFDAVLDTQMDEKTALEICQFLSSDAIEPSGEVVPASPDSPSGDVSVVTGPGGRRRKEGYLTKRGKNFGGWKARYFFLDGPHLRYYEAPGGAHMGTIKLQNAQIGKQSQQNNGSPSRVGDDDDNQYRHAFLILEPKKKDSSSHVRHTLCAENDEERDEWVEALLQYVDYNSEEEEEVPKTAPLQDKSSKSSGLHSMKMFVTGRKDGREADSPSAASYQEADALRGISYDDTVQADAPVNGTKSAHRDQETPSPPLISKPTNAAKIEDAEAWGNKSVASADKREHKKRSIFGFRGRTSSDSNSQLNGGSTSSLGQASGVERSGPVRAVFGATLADAAEYCRPIGVDVYLPAVVYRSIEYLEAKNAAFEEGIFRQSGSNTVIKALRERFNIEGDVNILVEQTYFDVHAVASLLKLYLRELPATILTRELHLDFIRVLELEERQKKVTAFNILVHKLPKPNWWLLRALSAFLLLIINHSAENKMTVRNVGIVFSPTLNIPAPVFSMFLTDFDAIFGTELDGSVPSPIDVSPTAPSLTPEDIRSPRRQMFQELPTPSFNQSSFPGLPSSPRNLPTANPPEPRSPYNTGFIPMHPSYQQPGQKNIYVHQVTPANDTSHDYSSLNGALAPTANAGSASLKAKRRESSMLTMDFGLGQRASSMQQLRDNQEVITE